MTVESLTLQSDVLEIYKGEDVTFDIYLYDEDGRPFPLTSYNKFRVAIKGSGTNIVTVNEVDDNGSIVVLQAPADLGHLQVTIKAAKTALLQAADKLIDVDLELNHTSPNPKKKRFENVLLVKESLA